MKQTAFFLCSFLVLAALPAGAQNDSEAEVAEPLWTTSAGFSYVSNSGNTETQSFGLDLKGVHQPKPWGLEFNASLNRGEENGVLNAERYFAGLRGTRSLNSRWSLFGGLNWEKNVFAGLDARMVLEGGAAFQALDDGTFSLSFDGGLTWTDEDRIEPNPDSDFMGGMGAAHFGWAISDNASLTEDLSFFPNFDESSDWRLESVLALQASLTERLALRFSYEYRFRNEPIGNNDDTDTTTKASVVVNF